MTPNPKPPAAAAEIGEFCAAGRVRKLSRAVSAVYDEALRPHGIRVSQLTILALVAALRQAAPSDLERYLLMDRSTVSRNVKRMCDQGWLATAPAPDARSHFIEATAPGHKLLQRALPDWRVAQRRARALLGDDNFDAVVRAANSLPVPSR